MPHHHRAARNNPCDHKGYEVGSCEDRSTLRPDATPNFIAKLYLDVDKALSKDEAREILKNLDAKIEKDLQSSQKPTDLAYHLANKSPVEFWAKSRKVKGELGVEECVERNTRQVGRLPDDGNDDDPTPPASPRSDVAHLFQEKGVEVIEI
ncbi:hypothetical protein DL771_000694 [Monosporascus sp. 5C6A]|nr:hypothetical protein DL771_000694 [Monosporascus sp. 5C6A]